MPRFIRYLLPATVAVAAPASGAQAQSLDRQCATGSTELEDACQKAIDLFAFFTPQLGVALSGGNAMLGAPDASAGLLRISVDVHATALSARIPQFVADTPVTTGARSTDWAVEPQLVALPVATASVGLIPAVRVAGQTLLSVDALLSATVVPNVATRDLQLTVQGSPLGLGFGARVGLVAETSALPSISISYLTRALPKLDILATTAEDDSLTLGGLDAQTKAFRLVVSKRAGPIAVAAGYGRDTYQTSAQMRIVIDRPTIRASGTPFAFEQRVTRNNFFGDVAFHLGRVTLGVEGGIAGRSAPIPTFNSFSGERPEDSRAYGAVGIRFGI